MNKAACFCTEEKYKDTLTKDKELACAPIDSKLGKDYIEAMKAAANFAFANKQILTHWLRENLKISTKVAKLKPEIVTIA